MSYLINCNYSVPQFAINLRALNLFCPDFKLVSMTDLQITLAHQHINKLAHQNHFQIFNPIAIGSPNFQIFKSHFTSAHRNISTSPDSYRDY